MSLPMSLTVGGCYTLGSGYLRGAGWAATGHPPLARPARRRGDGGRRSRVCVVRFGRRGCWAGGVL